MPHMGHKNVIKNLPALVALFFLVLPALSAFSQDVDTAWVRRFNGPGNGDDQAVGIAVDSSGNVYVTGFCFDSVTGYDFCTIKYLPNGDTAWVRRYDGPASQGDYAVAIALGTDGNIYVLGTVTDTISNPVGRSSNSGLIKYSPEGDLLWSNIPNRNSPAVASALTVDRRGNVYVADTRYNYVQYNPYIFFVSPILEVIKYSATGDFLWVGGWGYCPYSSAKAVAVDGQGGVYLAGTENVANLCEYGVSDFYCVTFKLDSVGQYLWTKYYNGGIENIARAIAVDSVGNAFVTGESSGDYATIKYLPNGDTAWVRRYAGPGGFGDYAYAIEVDGFGNVYVAGESNGAGTSQDFATIKYYPNGDTAWIRRYNGPGNDNEERPSLTIDNSGNVFITGPSADVGSVYDYATIKYDSLGNQVWVKRYDGPAHSDDHSNAITVDALGNVYVTGRSLTDTTYDYVTINYAPLPQLKGDLNLDGVLSLQDVIISLNCTFLGEAPPAAPAACDINCDGKITPADVVVLLLMVFAAVPAPC